MKPGVRYWDFRQRPDLIPKVLEDFLPWDHFPAVQTFCRLLDWINGPESVFESNDSRLTGVRPNEGSPGFKKKWECLNGVMIFLREIRLNLSADHVNWYTGRLLQVIEPLDPTFRDGIVTLTFFPTEFDLPDERLGRIVLITSWAFGDTDHETMANLERCLVAVETGLKQVSAEITAAAHAV